MVRGRWLSVSVALVFSLLGLNWSVPDYLDSDTILQPLMSTQNLTLFYWGQDRYLSLMPFLTGVIRDLQTNFIVVLVATGAAYFLLLELVADTTAQIYFPQRRPEARLIMLLSLVLASVAVLGKAGLYNFAYAAQPYGISCLLIFTAWRLVFRRARPSGAEWVLITVCLLIAGGLNPGALVVTLGLFAAIAAWRPSLKPLVPLAIALIGYLFWGTVSKGAAQGPGVSYTDFAFVNAFGKLATTLQLYQRDTGHLIHAAIALVVVLALGFLPALRAGHTRAQRAFSWTLSSFAITWWIVFANNTWVQMNGGVFRYFFPSLMALVFFVALRVTQVFLTRGRKVLSIVAILLCAGTALLLIRPVAPIGQYAVFAEVAGAQRYAASRQPRLIAGNYWMAWPVVFLSNARAYREGRLAVDGAYGVAVRGDVNRAAIDALLLADYRSGTKSRALCVGDSVESCRQQLTGNTAFFWDFLEQGDCLAMCYLFEVASMQVRTTAAIDPSLASGISLTLDAKVDPGLVYVLVSIANRSDRTLSSLSDKGDLKLSWRIYPETNGVRDPPGWDARRELLFSLAPGKTRVEPLALALPATPGRYRIEVSLVQEGVAWLHDIGMQVASTDVNILPR